MYFSWSDPYIVSTLVVGVVSFLVAAYWWQLRKYPPGPLPLPILGNILMIRSSLKLYEDFQAWSRKYGDPFTVWLFNRPCVIINDPKNVAECHAGDKRYHFSSRPPTNMAKLFVGGGDDVFFNSVDPALVHLSGAVDENTAPRPVSDAISALVNLGYGQPQAAAAIASASRDAGEKADTAQLIRLGLKELAK